MIVSSYHHETSKWTIKANAGVNQFSEVASQLLGRSLINLHGRREFYNVSTIHKNKLSEVSTDPATYSRYGLPLKGLQLIFKKLKIETIYEIVFAKDHEVLGFVNIIQQKGSYQFNKDLIEAFLSQVSVFLHRQMAESELKKYKQELELQVKKRTRELEEKNDELEKFNQLFIGREYRIKELKEQLKQLKNR